MESHPKRKLLFEPEEAPRSSLVWLAALTILACIAGAAFSVWRQANTVYTAEGTLWLNAEAPASQARPVALRTDVNPEPIITLLRSDEVLDWVAYRERLFLHLDRGSPEMLQGLWLADAMRPGTYEMRVGRDTDRFVLTTGEGTLVERGRLGDGPVGESVGLRWNPEAGALPPGASVRFQVRSPADAARSLNQRVRVRPGHGSTLVVSVDGADPEGTERIVNALMDRLVQVVQQRQRTRDDALMEILEGSASDTERQLQRLERALHHLRSIEGLDAVGRAAEERRLSEWVAEARARHADLGQRIDDTRRAASSTPGEVAVLDYAVAPSRPSHGTRAPLVLAFLTGLLGMAGLAMTSMKRFDARSRCVGEDLGSDLDDALAVGGIVIGALAAAAITALFGW